VLVLLYGRGFHGLAAVLLVPVSALLWRLRSDAAQGLELGWRQGNWYVCRAGERREVEPGRRTVVMAWVMYLDLIPFTDGSRERVWLYADSIARGELRRLRGRLSLLQHGGC
jgi:hypothetical protein